MKRILRWLLRRLVRIMPGILQDSIVFTDTLVITMRNPDGTIYKQWEEKGHTWVVAGLTLVRNALTAGGFTIIGFMYQNGGEGAATMATGNSNPAADKARFVATWVAAGLISGITQFAIRQLAGGANLSEVTVVSFDKPDGISLQVTWDTTIS